MLKQELIKVRRLRDALDMPVDEGVETLVSSLRLQGFRTTASCSGHIERVTSGPYVMMESPEGAAIFKAAPTDSDTLKHAQAVTLRDAARLLDIVRTWPGGHSEPSTQIEVRPVGYAQFRLCFVDADFDAILTADRYREVLQMRNEALHLLTTYLLET